MYQCTFTRGQRLKNPEYWTGKLAIFTYPHVTGGENLFLIFEKHIHSVAIAPTIAISLPCSKLSLSQANLLIDTIPSHTPPHTPAPFVNTVMLSDKVGLKRFTNKYTSMKTSPAIMA